MWRAPANSVLVWRAPANPVLVWRAPANSVLVGGLLPILYWWEGSCQSCTGRRAPANPVLVGGLLPILYWWEGSCQFWCGGIASFPGVWHPKYRALGNKASVEGFCQIMDKVPQPTAKSLSSFFFFWHLYDLPTLSRYLPSASALRSLDLSGNTELGNQGCCQVLRACRKTSLSCLSLAACGMVSPLPDVLVQVFSKLPLTCKLELTGNSIDGTDRLLIAVPVE